MTDDRIIKAYQGMSLQKFYTLNNSTRETHLVSYGALFTKYTKILEFVYWIKNSSRF